MSLFQSNLRKQIRNLPKILNFVKIIHYYSKLFTSVLIHLPEGPPGSDLERLRDFGHLVKEPGLLGLLEEGIQLAFP